MDEERNPVFLRWLRTLGLDFFAALHRKGWIRDDEDEDE